MMYKRFVLFLYIGVFFDTAAARYPYDQQCAEWLQEFFLLNQYFFSRDTVRVFCGFAPLYIAARSFDHHVHRYMYESQHHRNKQPVPPYIEWFCDEWGEIIPLVGLSSFAFVHTNMYLRTVSRLYMFGAISASVLNKLCKHMLEREWTRRPLNGDFPKRYVHGGFPSGHAAILNYTWVYWGLSYGPKVAVPLGIYGVLTSLLMVQCNRHYFSQVVAGAALGISCAFATHKAAMCRYDHVELSVGMTVQAKPILGVFFRF